jgi:DNA modification methylase
VTIPYYADEFVTLYHGDCRSVLPFVSGDVLCTDPPYGIGADRNLRAGKRHGAAAVASKDYGVGSWDSARPPQWLLEQAISKTSSAIVWGGNYFALPSSACWLVWDKDNGTNGYADCELAWTNLSCAVRRIRYRWMGMLQEHGGAYKEERVHPTQKPTEVMRWALALTAGSVLDPFAGSGTTLVAAKNLGRKAIGIEIEERYCEIAAKRLAQGVLWEANG